MLSILDHIDLAFSLLGHHTRLSFLAKRMYGKSNQSTFQWLPLLVQQKPHLIELGAYSNDPMPVLQNDFFVQAKRLNDELDNGQNQNSTFQNVQTYIEKLISLKAIQNRNIWDMRLLWVQAYRSLFHSFPEFNSWYPSLQQGVCVLYKPIQSQNSNFLFVILI